MDEAQAEKPRAQSDEARVETVESRPRAQSDASRRSDKGDSDWRSEGSNEIGKRVRRSVPDEDQEVRFADGSVIAWLPSAVSDFFDAAGAPAPLYRIKFDAGWSALRGDEEDLELHELQESLLPAGPVADDDGLVVVVRGQSEKSEYEVMREANIRRNRAVLEQLGLGGPSPGAVVVKKRSRKKKERPSETRRSARVAAIGIVKVKVPLNDDEYDDGYVSEEQEAWDSSEGEGHHDDGSKGPADLDVPRPSLKKAKKTPAPGLTFKVKAARSYKSTQQSAPPAAIQRPPPPDDDDLLQDELDALAQDPYDDDDGSESSDGSDDRPLRAPPHLQALIDSFSKSQGHPRLPS
ncbi:hypothetical protein M885DRAFT_618488 [Pelagophyceae sp. CCMP2097]|nr:hypothetical protein M885DRAFT_618488 [Pelagophyceae sp. CCMP2097]